MPLTRANKNVLKAKANSVDTIGEPNYLGSQLGEYMGNVQCGWQPQKKGEEGINQKNKTEA